MVTCCFRFIVCASLLYFVVRVECRRKTVHVFYLISWWASCLWLSQKLCRGCCCWSRMWNKTASQRSSYGLYKVILCSTVISVTRLLLCRGSASTDWCTYLCVHRPVFLYENRKLLSKLSLIYYKCNAYSYKLVNTALWRFSGIFSSLSYYSLVKKGRLVLFLPSPPYVIGCWLIWNLRVWQSRKYWDDNIALLVVYTAAYDYRPFCKSANGTFFRSSTGEQLKSLLIYFSHLGFSSVSVLPGRRSHCRPGRRPTEASTSNLST